MEFFATASNIEEIEDHFNMDEFSDVTMLNKPMIFISPKEIASTHQLLLDHQKEVCWIYVIAQLKGGGGGSAYHFGDKDFELGVGGKARTRPDILRVVLGPYVQYCPCEASE